MLKVLVADDEVIECRYLIRLFDKHKEKFAVAGEAHNGKEIIELAEKLEPDIIIMDINMPLMNGLDSAYEIKKRFPDVCILLNTAYAEFEFAKKAVDYNLDAYLLKPAREEEILQVIQTCLERRVIRDQLPSRHTEHVSRTSLESSKSAVVKVKEYIDENSHLPVTLKELADLVHFSPTYLSRLFHQEQGITLKSYVNKKRLENARYLLTNSDISINQIAAQCGFPNISHFNRLFKQQIGNAPLEYRNLQNRKGQP